jgi:ribonuclease HI
MNGCRWTIGSGNNVSIMGDPWLRGEEGAWIQSPQMQGAYTSSVNDLMLPNEKMWDKEKLENMFTNDVVGRILNIPLFDICENDRLVWMDDLNGQYSVKSGYKLMLNSTGRVQEERQQEDWNCLWKIHAPPRAKHLLWRICKGCLPTRTRLQERCVQCPLSCPICEQSNEDEWHILFTCNVSEQARQSSGLEHVLLPRLQQLQSTKDIIFSICQQEDKNMAGRFALLVWTLWNNRNAMVWNNTKDTGRNLGIKSRHLWEDWNVVQNRQQLITSRISHQQGQQSWQKPPIGWYKCNVDAGFHNERNKTSVGWCLRDHLGRFVLAGTHWKEGRCSIAEGESIALLQAMKESELRCISQVIFETDSKCVGDAIHALRVGTSEFSSLIHNINNVLTTNSNFVVKFVKRQANMVAHSLARTAVLWYNRNIIELLPHCIATLLNNEMI